MSGRNNKIYYVVELIGLACKSQIFISLEVSGAPGVVGEENWRG